MTDQLRKQKLEQIGCCVLRVISILIKILVTFFVFSCIDWLRMSFVSFSVFFSSLSRAFFFHIMRNDRTHTQSV